MEKSDQINELASALSKAQAEFTNIIKDQTAKIVSKTGASFSYSYADLASLLDMVRKPLAKNGLAVMQFADTSSYDEVTAEGKVVTKWRLFIETMLIHSTGQFIKNKLNLPIVDTGNNAIQAIGSTCTYGRRYELSSMLGIASEVDDDANSVPPTKQTATSAVNSEKKTETNGHKEPPKRFEHPASLTLKGMLEKLAIEKFGSLEEFQVWRIDNNLPENLDGLKDFDLAKVMTAVREYNKKDGLGLPERIG